MTTAPTRCECGIPTSVPHVHAEVPSKKRCWCGRFVSIAHDHAGFETARPVRCTECGRFTIPPHEHVPKITPRR